MKALEELTVLTVDAGTFPELANMMGRVVNKSLYYSAWEQEYISIERACIGDGEEHFERCDDFWDPAILKTIDLALFPDIGYGGWQKHMRDLGIAVWGSMGASDLELCKTRFLKVLESLDLPVVHSEKKVGLTALAEHLKTVKDKWVKINRYRSNMETWHHIDFQHSERELERLASEFGPLKEYAIFVVQDAINDEEGKPVVEIGYDGWTVDGKFPPASFQGYEKKNELYIGSRLEDKELPEPVKLINEKVSDLLAGYGYRNFWATEIRVKDGVPYFIDPTARIAGQTMEHLLESCVNLPEVIYRGALGELIEPDFNAGFSAEATLHYTEGSADAWKTIRVPESIRDRVKLYQYCAADGAYHFPAHKNDELGVIIGNGDSIESALEDLKQAFAEFGEEPVKIELSGFADLLKQIKDAESEGIEFSDQPLPAPEIVLQSESES